MQKREFILIRRIVELGTVTAAAVELGQSQPAASALLNNFEKRLGFRIFNRSGRVMKLTRQGTELLPQILSALAATEAVAIAAQNLRRGLPSKVAVGAVAIAGVTIVPAVLNRLTAEYQKVQTTILSGTTRDLVRLAAEEQLDLAVILGDPYDERVSILQLGQVGLHAIVHAEHPFAGRAGLRLDDLRRERLILLRPELPVGALAGKHLDLNGLDYANGVRVSQSVVACAMVHLREGIAVLENLSAEYGRRQGLAAIPIEVDERLPVNLVASKNVELGGLLGSIARQFLDEAQRIGLRRLEAPASLSSIMKSI